MSFAQATRQNWHSLTGMNYAAGQIASKDLPRVGLLARLLVVVKGTVTVAHASQTTVPKAEKGPWALIKRIKLVANSGVEIFNTTGFGAYLLNAFKRQRYALDEAVANDDAFVFENAASSGGVANKVQFAIEIPVALNERDPIGLILLQNQETLLTLQIEWADAGLNGVLYTSLSGYTLSNPSFTAYPLIEYFSVPARKEDYPDLSLLHQVIEERVNILGVGETYHSLPRGNIYVAILNYVEISGALAAATDVENWKLMYNQAETPYNVRGELFRALMRQRYGRFLGKGVYCWDFNYQGIPGLANSRDYINSAAITEFQQVLTVSPGATLGQNNNFINAVREQLVPLAPAA